MNALRKKHGTVHQGSPSKGQGKPMGFEPRPCGEIDYDALAEEVSAKYPAILNRLAE